MTKVISWLKVYRSQGNCNWLQRLSLLIAFYNKTYKIYDNHAPWIKTKRFKGLDADLSIIARIWNCQILKMVTCHWVKSSKSKNFVSKNVVRFDSLNDLFNRSPIARVTYNYCLFLMITVHNNEEIKHNEVTALCEFVLHYVYSFCYLLIKVSCRYYNDAISPVTWLTFDWLYKLTLKIILLHIFLTIHQVVLPIHIPYSVYIYLWHPCFIRRRSIRLWEHLIRKKSLFRHLHLLW